MCDQWQVVVYFMVASASEFLRLCLKLYASLSNVRAVLFAVGQHHSIECIERLERTGNKLLEATQNAFQDILGYR